MIGKTIQQRYNIEKELGRGGMGNVYKAYDTSLKRDVAIKVLNTEGMEIESKDRLQQEAQISAQLNHPNIVTTFDVGEIDGLPFIVMELVEGGSLYEHKPNDVEEVISFSRNICAALEHAHNHGIVHRDLKPENVLLTSDGDVKLMDFGLARPTASRLTVEDQITGTVYYMAPELIMGQTYDGRADLYALGIMLYELVTGELPFDGDNPISIISQHLHTPVQPPVDKSPNIPSNLNHLILSLLRKDQNDRPASAGEVIQILDSLQQPVIEDTELDLERLKISTLGGLSLKYKGEPVKDLASRKADALLVYLACAGRTVSREILAELLWEERGQVRAMSNLRVVLSSLRKELGDFITITRDSTSINRDANIWLDVNQFERLLNAGEIENALKIYRGDFLEGFYLRDARNFEDWTAVQRERFKRMYLDGLDELVDKNLDAGDYTKGIHYASQLLSLDPARESGYQKMMRLLVYNGQREAAMEQYQDCWRVLGEKLGLEPTQETRDLYQEIIDEKLAIPERVLTQKSESLLVDASDRKTPLVGRGNEMAKIDQLLSKTAASQGQAALIAGEPGIGKSRLIQEMVTQANRQGFQPLSAYCYQVEQSMPYQPLIDLVRQAMSSDDRWQQLAPVWLRELAVLVPEIDEAVTAATGVILPSDDLAESQQVRLFQAIFNLFANQADRHKLLLVIEDIFWANPATLKCLHYLARRIARVPIALILSSRGETLSTDLALDAMLADLRRETHFTYITLDRLTEVDTTALLEQTAGTAPFADRLGHWLHRETDGNPFFFISLLQSLREEGLLDNTAEIDWQTLVRTDPTLTLPDAIQDSVLARLQRLPQNEREVLDWMAVYGRGLDFSTLQAISQQPDMTLLNAVEKLMERQLLVETTRQYDFDHNKIREVVYYDLSAARRGLYHRKIAETLEGLTPSPDQASIIAYHFERGEENEKALTYWMRAGDQALDTYAYQQAAHHYERVLTLTDQPAEQMDAYLGSGRALTLLDDHKKAAANIQQGLHLAERHGDDTRRAWLLYVQAQNASRQHRTDGGKSEVEAALHAAEQAGDDYHLAQSLLLLTEVQESRGDLSEALKTVTRAQMVCNKLKNNRLEARALAEIGFIQAQQADFEKSANSAKRVLELLENADDRNAIAYTWNILGRALGGRGDYSRALYAFQRSQEEAQIVGDRYLLAQVFNMRGWIHRELCDYENGLKLDEEGIDFSKQWGKVSPEISARLNVCLDLLHLDDPGQALELLGKIEDQINTGSYEFHRWRWQLRLLHARGLCFLALNEPAKALALAEEGMPLAETAVIRKYVALNHELMGMALTKLDRDNEAIEAIKKAISLADIIQYQPVRWASRHLLAELYHKKGREQEVQKISDEAVHIIHAIAGKIKDENLQATFLNKALS